jgi:hypothetical protein
MTRKLTLFFVCVFEIGLILFVAAWTARAEPVRITAKNILSLFPICELPSSLGQRCKYDFKDNPPKDFIDVCCPNGHKISFTESSVEVLSAADWLYRFDVSSLSANYARIRFEDKAMNGGNYHTVAKFITYIDEGKLKLWNYSTTRY